MFIRLHLAEGQSKQKSTSSCLESLYRNRNFRGNCNTSAELSKDRPTIDHSASRPHLPSCLASLCRYSAANSKPPAHIHIFVLSHTPLDFSVTVSSVDTTCRHCWSLILDPDGVLTADSFTTHHSPHTTSTHCQTPALHAITPVSSTKSFPSLAARRCDHETSDIPKNIPAPSGLTQRLTTSQRIYPDLLASLTTFRIPLL